MYKKINLNGFYILGELEIGIIFNLKSYNIKKGSYKMQEKDFQKVINDMKETLGEENIGKIADSLGILITDNSNMNKDLAKKDDEIKILKDDKERLITTNGKLLQQVSYGTEEEIIDTGKEKEEKKKYIDYKLGFDEKRKFQTIV